MDLDGSYKNNSFELKSLAIIPVNPSELVHPKSINSRFLSKVSEPLFGRFAHVYIDTDSDEWLKWALKRKKEGRKLEYTEHLETDTIHPAIVDYKHHF